MQMKRKAQERIYQEARGLSREQELEYFHEAAEQFWQDIRALRKERVPTVSGTAAERSGDEAR